MNVTGERVREIVDQLNEHAAAHEGHVREGRWPGCGCNPGQDIAAELPETDGDATARDTADDSDDFVLADGTIITYDGSPAGRWHAERRPS